MKQIAIPFIALAIAITTFGPRQSANAVADPVMTPGVTNPDVTQVTISTTICVKGWTKTIRPSVSYTNSLKYKQIRLYKYSDQNMRDFEEDHLISLELGGSPKDPKNLWPEPHPRSFEVDKIENHLHYLVCHGKMTLVDAQKEIVSIKHTQG